MHNGNRAAFGDGADFPCAQNIRFYSKIKQCAERSWRKKQGLPLCQKVCVKQEDMSASLPLFSFKHGAFRIGNDSQTPAHGHMTDMADREVMGMGSPSWSFESHD